jgi:response regulator of citrate/malate metabolism
MQSYLRGLQYEREKKKVTNEKGVNQHSEVEGQNVQQPSTADKLAEQHGVSRGTIKRDAEYARVIDTVVSTNLLT